MASCSFKLDDGLIFAVKKWWYEYIKYMNSTGCSAAVQHFVSCLGLLVLNFFHFHSSSRAQLWLLFCDVFYIRSNVDEKSLAE